MDKKTFPSHFPRGTVITTNLWYRNEAGESIQHFHPREDLPRVEFEVDHVKTSPSTIRDFLIVTTTKKTEPLYEGDDFVVFNVHHVNKIISVGSGPVVIENVRADRYNFFPEDGLLTFLELCFWVRDETNKLSPNRWINVANMARRILDERLVTKHGSIENYRGPRYTFKSKRLKKWIKRNLNRFIMTEAEKEKMVYLRDKEAEEDFNRMWEDDERDDHVQVDQQPDDEVCIRPSSYEVENG